MPFAGEAVDISRELTRLVKAGVDEARAAGCAWPHVGFEPHLEHFHLNACGFRATVPGLVQL